ncbi:cysteine hydrolase family protein [Frigidibacter sp. MR17.24]|uniref:cysteine hydrolase family protein n=1 Tax=Frigidibacter sp. MR17.24 TaxID=3127345 RepID=UPI003012B71B
MHSTAIPDEILARTRARRLGRSFLDRLDPATTALLVIDLQDGFLREGALLEVPLAREIVPVVNRLAADLRAAGGHVAFSRFAYLPDEPHPWTVFYDRFLNAEIAQEQKDAFAPGAADLQLWSALEVAGGDFVFDKSRYSAFTPGTSPLPGWLERRGIRTVIVVGTLSNCCCESTARDALQHGYDVIFVEDANATLSDAEHTAALVNMLTLFADVVPAQAVCDRLSGRAAA